MPRSHDPHAFCADSGFVGDEHPLPEAAVLMEPQGNLSLFVLGLALAFAMTVMIGLKGCGTETPRPRLAMVPNDVGANSFCYDSTPPWESDPWLPNFQGK